MVKDLTTNYKLVGVNTRQLINRLGEPDIVGSDSLIYKLEAKYGSDIDPVYHDELIFRCSKTQLLSPGMLLTD